MTSSSQLYTSGLASYRATSFETAIELFTSAIELDPTQAKLYDARAGAYEQVGRLKDALGDVREVVRLLPESYKGFLRGGRLWKKAGKWEKAEKMLVQGLGKVGEGGGKVREEFEKELAIVREIVYKASYSPISRLPADLFLDIILLASTPPPREWTSSPTPRSKTPSSNALFSAMHVSRTWHSAISSSPRLWDTLAIDGVINRKNAVEKAVWWSRRARGRRAGEGSEDDAKGLRRIVITAASEINPVTFGRLYEALKQERGVGDLRELTISFVDGAIDTFEATQVSTSFAFLSEACGPSLETFVYATEAKVDCPLDISRLGAKFPSLRDFRICGGNGRRVSLWSVDVVEGYSLIKGKVPLPLARLALRCCDLFHPVKFSDFPALRSVELSIFDKGDFVVDLLSTPSLTRFHLHAPFLTGLSLSSTPDISSAWRVVEDLALVGHPFLISPLLNFAVTVNLAFPFLTTLDLTGARLTQRYLSLFDFSNAPLLTSLNLRNTTYSSLVPTLPSLLFLRSLNVANTMWTNDTFVRCLIDKTPLLTQINLSGNPLLTGRPIMELVRSRAPEEGSRSDLVDLRLEGCVGIETSAVEWLRKAVRPGGVRFQFMETKEKAAKRPRLR